MRPKREPKTMQVRAIFEDVPLEAQPKARITRNSPVTVPDVPYYRKRIRKGELELVEAPKAKPEATKA